MNTSSRDHDHTSSAVLEGRNYDGGKSLGRRLCDAFAETFSGGGWADAPQWDDYDAWGQARFERAAVAFVAKLSTSSTEQVTGEGSREEP